MTDTLPESITNTKHPTDQHDLPIEAGKVYLITNGGRPQRVLVTYDVDFDAYLCVPCTERGKPIPDSIPQRIDETDPSITWEHTELQW